MGGYAPRMTTHDTGRPDDDNSDDDNNNDPDADPDMLTSGAGTHPDQAEGEDMPAETEPPQR
ncbi:MAG: hypothetical protein K0R68_88 [Mycobacterium sp.]|nr:hypothetical protein [Mycobacterium sp.]